MCGIAGFIGKRVIPGKNISDTLQLMKQRGPDFQHSVAFSENGSFISLLHSRLSIIDLDPRSNQPFTIGNCTIIFNGEIYNYLELAKDLKARGVSLRTGSDTEVLLHYFLIYKEKCVNYFEGMWAFAVYDAEKDQLFLSRDRFAEKPLYYFQSGEGFYFGSETRFLRSLSGQAFHVNEGHLLRYLVNGHKSLYKTTDTFFNSVFELPPSSNMTISSELKITESNYWKPGFSPVRMSQEEAVNGIRERLFDSVKIRLRADVPLAFCLSGGVDSSSLVSIAAKKFNFDVTSFSVIDADARYDEEENIDATVNDIGCKNFKVKLFPEESNMDRLKEVVAYHDAPVATISYFVHSLLSEAISKNGFKISVSGTGADELFTGYYDHFNLHLYEMRNDPSLALLTKDWTSHVLPFVRHPYFQKPDLYFKDPTIRGHIYLNNDEFASYLTKEFSEPFTETKYSDSLLRNRMMNELFHEVVRVILHEDDLNSMMYSVENRSPFLDSKLFEFVNTIPNDLLIKQGFAKHLLREAMKGILNDKVRLAREKKGFNASINSIIDFKDPKQREYLLDESPVFKIISRAKIEKLMNGREYSNSFKKFLFNFINAKIFLEQNQKIT